MHRLPAFVAIEEGRLGWEAYADLLLGLHRYHASIGKPCRAAAGLTTGAARLQRLRRDLAHLGRSAEEDEPDTGTPAGEAEALGYAYVAQGSVLGGAVIARQLDYMLGDRADGRRFFQPTREDALAWRRLCAALERRGREPESLERMIAGAEAAFRLFEDCVGPAAAPAAL
jgi:heme oxygenase